MYPLRNFLVPSFTLFFLFVVQPLHSAHLPDTLGKSSRYYIEESRGPLFGDSFHPLYAIDDPEDRITKAFKVPEILKKRTIFWFNIYTKYSSMDHVVHHTRYPWIIYKVIDTTHIYKGLEHRWTKYHKARRFVAKEKQKIRRALRRLSKKRKYSHLKGLEKELYYSLAPLRGKRRNVFRFASWHVRSQLGQRNFFLSGLKNSSRYLPFMEAEFEKLGLPHELTRIPFVESSFNEKAHSRVGASGVWQLMPAVGRHYLKMTKYIDERNSPIKSTVAAAKLMKYNFRLLKDWPLAVTAYNHGVGGIRKALRRSKSKTLAQIISRYHRGSFKFASSNFYTSFLAALHAEKYSEEIFQKHEVEREDFLDYELVLLDRRRRTRQVMKLSGLDKETFLRYNMDLKRAYKRNTFIPKGFKLLLPPENKIKFEKVISKSKKRSKHVRL